MTIWHHPNLTLDALNQRGQNTLVSLLDIKFIDIGDNYLTASMPVDDRTRQPIGILHGGANVVLAETIASTAANAVIDIKTHYCVVLEITANHIRPVRSGIVFGHCSPYHIGRSTQVWHIEIKDEE